MWLWLIYKGCCVFCLLVECGSGGYIKEVGGGVGYDGGVLVKFK